MRTDGWTDMTKLTVTLRNFSNAPKKRSFRINEHCVVGLYYLFINVLRVSSRYIIQFFFFKVQNWVKELRPPSKSYPLSSWIYSDKIRSQFAWRLTYRRCRSCFKSFYLADWCEIGTRYSTLLTFSFQRNRVSGDVRRRHATLQPERTLQLSSSLKVNYISLQLYRTRN
jgi:hypothetical protein